MTSSLRVLTAALPFACALCASAPSYAQEPEEPKTAAARTADEDDGALKLAEPDFTLVGLPTALRLPRFKSAFRVTHRFNRPLGDGSFGDLVSDFFGLDSGARIALEYRIGLIRNGQVGIHRTSGRTIVLFGQYGVLRQDHQLPVDITAIASVEGTNNFKGDYSPTLGAIVSRTIDDWLSVYVEPMWVNNSNTLPKALVDHNDTLVVGLGTRVRVRPTVYVVVEAAPRAAGYRPDANHIGIAIEKWAGGHMFQLNFSDSFATTPGQFARGGPAGHEWFMGFNLTRKFF